MSKRITRIGLGAAVAVAASAVAGGAFASAASLPDQPASEAISGTVIHIDEDGSAVECTLTGLSAELFVSDPSAVAGDFVWGVTEVSVGDEAADGTVSEAVPIPATETVVGGELPEGTEMGVAVSGSTDVVVDGAEEVAVAPIVSFDAADVRPGTEEECAAIFGADPTVSTDAVAKD